MLGLITGCWMRRGNRFYGNTSGIYVNGGTLKIVGNEIRAGGSGINHGGGFGYEFCNS